MSAIAALAQRLGLRVDIACTRAAACGLRPSWQAMQHRCYAGKADAGTVDDHKEEIENINELFVEARDEIDYAKEDAETVYFNESCDAARKAVQDVIGRFNAVLDKLSEEERGKLQRSMGLKMEQLKAEVAQLDTLHD